MSNPSETLLQQYEEMAEAIETEGLGYAITNGYFNSNTEDEELNKAVIQAEKALATIEDILEPYRI